MYYLVDCDIARGVGLLIANKDSRKGSQNVKTSNQKYSYGDISTTYATFPQFIMKRFSVVSWHIQFSFQFSCLIKVGAD